MSQILSTNLRRHQIRLARLGMVLASVFLFVVLTTHAHDVVNLVGAYGLTEGVGTTTLDASGNSGPGTFLNGAAWIAGKYGFGASFDGTNDFITVPDSPSLQLGSTGTLEAWVSLNARNRWNGVLGKATSAADTAHNYAIVIDTSNRPICIIGNGTAFNQARSTTGLQARQFYHLACTWDGSQLRLYINGVLNRSVAQTVTPAGNSGPLVVGQYGGNTRYISGVIDEVRIFNIAVTQANIQVDMNAPVEATPDTVPPTVSLAAPTDNATVSGSVAIVANASDDRVVAGVTFFVDGFQVGPEDTTTTYSATWDSQSAINGPHTLTAVARDAAGNTTTSAPRTVTVANLPHLVITQPLNGAAISGSSLDITYVISGDVTSLDVDHVHFQVDGGPEIMDLPPIDGMKTITDIPPGTHTLTGFLVRADHSKIVGTDSTPVSFMMVVPDSTPPTVSMTNPSNGAAVSGVVTLSASASDNIGVVGVLFRVDGAGLGVEDTISPYTAQWNAVGNGPHVITAVARDASGNSTTSSPITVTVSDPNDPAVVGQWSSVMNWPLVAVHSALMPTGDILMWDAWENPAAAKVWNPTTNTFSSTPVSAGVFCSAQTVLSDGRILVIGGHAGGEIGIPDAFTFDPITKAWTRAAYMNFSRWYPSATRLGDGRVVVVSGQVVPGSWADKPEIFDPGANQWTALNSAQTANMHDTEYPLSFLLPDGTIYVISAVLGEAHTMSVSPQSWSSPLTIPMKNGTAAMYRPGKLLMTGGGTFGPGPSQPNAAVVDTAGSSSAWRSTAPMAYGRYQHNLVVLANGDVLAVGGGNITTTTTEPNNGVLPAELWNPATEAWATMASMHDPRMYHSTAMLLPDGRVLSAGGGRIGSVLSFPTAEIFSPPYLFRGPRPTITNAPTAQALGDTLTIQTPDAANISRVAIVPLGAVTHTLNMNQTFVELPFSAIGTSLEAQVPVNSNVVPPGYYLLFILNNNGVPAIAPFLRITDPSSPTDSVPPTVAITNPFNGQVVAGTVTVSADASDNIGVTSVQFQLDGNDLGAADTTAPYALAWNTAQAVDGGHILTAIARDAAGNARISADLPVTTWNGAGPVGKYLGHTVVGTLVDSGDDNSITASRFVMPNETGNAVSLSAYIEAPASAPPNNQFQGAIYADSGGIPGALLASTASGTIVPGAWNTVAISTTVQANTAYWLAYNTNSASSSANNTRIDVGTAGQFQFRGQAFGTWPSSFGTPAGNSAYQASIYVTYVSSGTPGDTTAPTVSITSPTGGTWSGTINVDATASDNIGVSSVQFQLDGQALGSPDTTAPYSISWNTALTSDGTHVLTAVARDAAGNVTTSAGISVTVSNASGDTTAPTVSVTSPTDGTTVSGTINVNATASDNIGVTSVQFRLDGQVLGGPDTTAPYSISWNTALTSNGTHVLTAVASDAAGNVTTSAGVSVTVSNASGGPKTLGYTAVGATTDSGDRNSINIWRFVMPNENGTATSLSIYVAGPISAAPNNQFQVAIYADQNGAPGALLASSASQTHTQNAWNTVPLTATLQPNAAYWLAYNTNAASDAANNIRIDAGSAGQMRWRSQSFGSWPATFGTAAGSAAWQASVYLTYTVP